MKKTRHLQGGLCVRVRYTKEFSDFSIWVYYRNFSYAANSICNLILSKYRRWYAIDNLFFKKMSNESWENKRTSFCIISYLQQFMVYIKGISLWFFLLSLKIVNHLRWYLCIPWWIHMFSICQKYSTRFCKMFLLLQKHVHDTSLLLRSQPIILLQTLRFQEFYVFCLAGGAL